MTGALSTTLDRVLSTSRGCVSKFHYLPTKIYSHPRTRYRCAITAVLSFFLQLIAERVIALWSYFNFMDGCVEWRGLWNSTAYSFIQKLTKRN